MKALFHLIGTVVLFWGVSVAAQQEKNIPLAILVTTARPTEVNRGAVLAHFPKAVIYRDPVRSSRAFLFFNSDTSEYLKSALPIQVTISTDGKESYHVDSEKFLEKLVALLQVQGKQLGRYSEMVSQFEDLTGFLSNNAQAWFLTARGPTGETESLRIELGTRVAIEAQSKSGAAIYERHFRKVAFELGVSRIDVDIPSPVLSKVMGLNLVVSRNTVARKSHYLIFGDNANGDLGKILDPLPLESNGDGGFSIPCDRIGLIVMPRLLGAGALGESQLSCESHFVEGRISENGIDPMRFVINLKRVEPETENESSLKFQLELKEIP